MPCRPRLPTGSRRSIRKSSRGIYITLRASRGKIRRASIGTSGLNSRAMNSFRLLQAAALFPAVLWSVPRNSVYAPEFGDIDFSVLKNIPITERFRAQFRVEFFNLLNRVNLAPPAVPSAAGSDRAATPQETFTARRHRSWRTLQHATRVEDPVLMGSPFPASLPVQRGVASKCAARYRY